METATGYSFPSGHSMNAASVYGGGAVTPGMPVLLRVALGALWAWRLSAAVSWACIRPRT